ncbi:tRNA (adenine(37)-N6)-methyltransferase-like [Homarus americanus]|uniref:tRNA (Adenine(37)-N6)-methyltransferase-like n=1 Tax=Homarus americanus TaxID=6706 RepID=A0A8J5MTY6_HOMAM|nr:tRNA (adenine(37)-N6)-methyltransferase-like [Homarus americanus]
MSIIIADDCVHLSGLDILDGTPVLDIKPYIPQYDAPNIISSTLDITPAQERIDLRKWDKLEYNKTKSVTEINVEENSFSNITVANSSQHSSKSKVVQTEQKIRCSDNEFISEPFSCYDKTNTIVSGSGIVNHQSPKLKDTKVLKLTKELGESSRTINIDGNSGSVDMSNSNCGKNKCLLSQLSKEIKPHLSLGNKHTEIQDLPTSSEQQDTVSDFEKSEEEAGVTTASWLRAPPATPLQVLFNPVAEMQIKLFSQREEQDSYRLEFLGDGAELRATISAVLGEDPRSAYRRQKCSSLLYYFTVDTAHITAWFEGDTAEVLRVHPLQTYKNTSSMET